MESAGVSYGLARLLPYKPLEPIELTCYFSWCSHATNNDSIDVICSHCPRHRHRKTSLLTHAILYKIRVRHRYFIKWVRPGRPGKNVTRLTRMIRMTRPGCNADTETRQYTYRVIAHAYNFILGR